MVTSAISLLELQTFVAVVECRSISAAAQRLNVAKSAVSKRLADLETSLGAKLILRSARGARTTSDGGAFYLRARDILSDLQDAMDDIEGERGVLRGLIRVAAPQSLGMGQLSRAVIAFMKQNPNVEVEVDLNDRYVDMEEQGFDLAIRIGRPRDTRLISKFLATSRRLLVASPAYLGKYGQPADIRSLEQHIGIRFSNVGAVIGWPVIEPDGSAVTSVRFAANLSVNSAAVMLEAAIEGLGIALLPTFIVWQAILDGRLQIVLPHIATEPEIIHCCYPAQRKLPRRVRELIVAVERAISEPPAWDIALRDAGFQAASLTSTSG